MTDISNWTVEDYAKHYDETINSPPNGWGQHISAIFGQSQAIMHRAQRLFGEKEMCRAFGLKYYGGCE